MRHSYSSDRQSAAHRSRSISCWLIAFSVAIFSSSLAHAANLFQVRPLLKEDRSQLTLKIEDTVEVQNACDYHVRRFEYLAGLKSLVIDLGEEPCHVDRTGKRKARLKWDLPSSLKPGFKLCVLINQKKLGALTLNDGKIDLQATEACE